MHGHINVKKNYTTCVLIYYEYHKFWRQSINVVTVAG
jgi:hypothetical protein